MPKRKDTIEQTMDLVESFERSELLDIVQNLLSMLSPIQTMHVLQCLKKGKPIIESKEESTKQYFVVDYLLAGQDGGGAWVVLATSKKEAKSIVKGIDEDYVKLSAQNKEEWLQNNGDEEEWNYMLNEHKKDLKKDGYAQLWCGT